MKCMNISPYIKNGNLYKNIITKYTTQVNSSEPAFYSHSDHLGSSTYITDQDGKITQTLAYLPYGEDWVDIDNQPPYITPYKFNGKEKDQETGYNYFGARYYDSKLSIFNSVDPNSDNYPHSTSYAYCNNNPIMLIDPDGKDWFENEKTGDVYYNSELRKGEEGKGAMTGDGWVHMGENGMFQNKDGSNKDSEIVRSKGGREWRKNVAGRLNTWAGSLSLEGDQAKSFMSDMGYKHVQKEYIYNENIQTTNLPEPHTIINLTTNNSSSQVKSYQYVQKGSSPSTQILEVMQKPNTYNHPLFSIQKSQSLRRDTYNGNKINSEHIVTGLSIIKNIFELWSSGKK